MVPVLRHFRNEAMAELQLLFSNILTAPASSCCPVHPSSGHPSVSGVFLHILCYHHCFQVFIFSYNFARILEEIVA